MLYLLMTPRAILTRERISGEHGGAHCMLEKPSASLCRWQLGDYVHGYTLSPTLTWVCFSK